MNNTVLTIDGTKFRINGELIYSEIPNSNPRTHGMLMNNRFIQGIFDTTNPDLFKRYNKDFDAETNTNEMIAALPQWYAKGLRAITVGMQGGGSCFSIKGQDLGNNPYSEDGLTIDPAYLARLDKVIEACDKIGMVVIVSYLYGFNAVQLKYAQTIINIVKTMSTYLKDKGYKNVIIEIANENNINTFKPLPIVQNPHGMVSLINFAKECCGGIPVGCSGGGGYVNEEICRASDVAIIHGNGESRGKFYNHILRTKGYSGNKPVIINEDSQAIGQLQVCEELQTSWGYYNNMTKQEPPTYWEITKGEEEYFCWRMAHMIGIEQEDMPEDEQYYFQGLEPHMHHDGIRYPRLASLYPETINYVRFYQNDELYYVAYDESFTVNYHNNWLQGGVQTQNGDVWKAEVVLVSGETKILTTTIENI